MQAAFPFKTMRQWIKFLEDKGQIIHIEEEVSLRGDVSAIARKARGLGGAPGIVLENIKGYPDWRIALNTLATPERLAWSTGVRKNHLMEDIAPKLDMRVPPMQVSTAPCKELKFFGHEVDLTKLPIPFTGKVEYEGTPNITAGVANKMDYETGWQNVAVRKIGLKGKRTLSEPINPMGQSAIIWAKYRVNKAKMPCAIALTPDPCVYMLAGAKPPVGICEYEKWGAFTGMPLEVVKCETNDLMVPASSEVVIEGEVDPYDRELDGPFSEYSGYFTRISAAARINVTCVTMRKDPIYYYMYMGLQPTEGHDVVGLMFAATVFRELSSSFPGILDVHALNFGSLVVLKVDKRIAKGWPDYAVRLANVIKFRLAAYVKGVIVVDDDVEDITNFEHISNAIGAKFQASKDLTIIPRTTGTLSEPSELWCGRWGWTDFFIMDCTEPMPPWDEGYLRGVSIPPEASTKKAETIFKKYNLL